MHVGDVMLSSSECVQISLIQYTRKLLPWWAYGPLYHFFTWVGRLITVPSGDGLENHRLKWWIITPHAPHHGRPPRAGEPRLLQYCWESPSLRTGKNSYSRARASCTREERGKMRAKTEISTSNYSLRTQWLKQNSCWISSYFAICFNP